MLLKAALAVSTAAAVNRQSGQAWGASAAGNTAEFVDTNVYLARWPCRRLWGDETPRLLAKLRAHGVTSAWAGSFDSLLHRDIAAVNVRLAGECADSGKGLLQAVGAINPALPDWEEDLRRCHEVHRMLAVRLHPNYHGYTLGDPRFARLLEHAARRGMLVQVALRMEDERTQHPLLQVAEVSPEPLVDLLPSLPGARLMLLNCFRSLRNNRLLLARLVRTGTVSFDISTLEVVAGVRAMLEATPGIPLVFGSYAPYFNFESAWLKLRESKLSANQLHDLRVGQAQAALAGTTRPG